MKASLLFVPALLLIGSTVSSTSTVQAQTPTGTCTVLPPDFLFRLTPAANAFAAPDGTFNTGCQGRTRCDTGVNGVCAVNAYIVKSTQAAGLYAARNSAAAGVSSPIAGLGTQAFYTGNPTPTVNFVRGDYFVQVMTRDDQAFARSAAAAIDANIQRLAAPPPAPTTAPAPPPAAVVPAAVPTQPSSPPLSSSDAELELRKALANLDRELVLDNIKGAQTNPEVAIAALDAWDKATGKRDGNARALISSYAALAGTTRDGQPLFPSLRSFKLMQVFNALALKGINDPDALTTASRLMSLLIRIDLAAAGEKK